MKTLLDNVEYIDDMQLSSKGPLLNVVIDTEEDFDWNSEFSRSNTSVKAMQFIYRIQNIFDEYNISPLYVVDYPVASKPEAYKPLKEIFDSGRCEIGAHLHPWVSPPFDEEVNRYHSFPGNLPEELEENKLKLLVECIEKNIGVRPVSYKAGRYGLGPNSFSILEKNGFEVDVSVCPYMNYASEGGPDFSGFTHKPFWFGKKRKLLELPLTVGYAGYLRHWGQVIHNLASKSYFRSLHPIGIMARLRIIDKIWLSPEGFSSIEHQRLVKDLFTDGQRVFTFAFHSSSIEPGNTPYVRTKKDLELFFSRFRQFFDFFFGELSGESTTPEKIKQSLTNN